jgi:hypothetical protein
MESLPAQGRCPYVGNPGHYVRHATAAPGKPPAPPVNGVGLVHGQRATSARGVFAFSQARRLPCPSPAIGALHCFRCGVSGVT